MHNVKNNLEVNCATASQNDRDGVPLLCNKPLVLDQNSQEVDSNEGGNEPFEKWCAPADFSLLQSNGALPLDSDNSTLKKNAMNLKNKLL